MTTIKFNARLVYSDDDKGYYWERFRDWKTSQIYATVKEARESLENNTIIWS